MQTRIYKNLHKTRQSSSPVYSVQIKTEDGWRLDHHSSQIYLKDVTFKVSQYGRQRCLARGQKVVHAYVCGEIIDRIPHETMIIPEGMSVTYNPPKAGHFYRRSDNVPVHAADYAVVGPQGILVFYINN